MKRKTLFAALACALLVFSMLGCGTTNHLQSITLSAKASTTTGGFYNLVGEGGIGRTELAERVDPQLAAEHRVVELHGLASVAVEREVRVELGRHRRAPLAE